MSILIETFNEQANYHKEVVGYECNGHRHITDLCRELKNVHVFSYLQIFISVFALVGCVLFRKNIKYIWPQIIPSTLAISSSSVYLAIFYKEHADDVWLNETSAFNAVIAMSLTTILITLIVMGIICVFFVYFERIFHQKKSFCTTTFLYTITFLILTFAIQTCITSTGWKYTFGECQDAQMDNQARGNIVYWGLEHCNLGSGLSTHVKTLNDKLIMPFTQQD